MTFTISPTKQVKVRNQEGTLICLLVQTYEGEEQVLQSKTYARLSSVQKWIHQLS